MTNYLSNIGSGGALPEVTDEIADDPKQIYRNTDNKVFEPELLVAVNYDDTDIQIMALVDCDLTDAGDEELYKDEDYPIYPFVVGPKDMTILKKNDLKGLRFKYGIGAYNSDSKAAGSGVKIYVAGREF